MCHECIIKAWVTHASVGPSAGVGGSDERTLMPVSVSGGTRESIGRLTSQGEIDLSLSLSCSYCTVSTSLYRSLCSSWWTVSTSFSLSLSLAPSVLCLSLSTTLSLTASCSINCFEALLTCCISTQYFTELWGAGH